jgi:methyl-accepting chemotaxis protein
LSQIDSVTQQNTANAEEGAAAAEELSGQANQLQQMLQRFTLKEGQQYQHQANPAPSTSQSSIGWKSVEQPAQDAVDESRIALDDREFGRF